MKKIYLLFVLLFSSHTSFAIELGDRIDAATEAYLKDGVDAFIPKLMKGSPLEGEKGVLTLSNNIRQIEAYYGKFLGIEPMREEQLSKRVRLVYYVMNYENSPVFGSVILYSKPEGEVITSFQFNTELWQITPNEVIFK
ncbi:hypothetical protein [Pseudoalteromonas sp. S4488]|uniref:hypothetical protein n=1 Tax=Pseudoalteromonas sp. S4488 TaxID=579558 RepID=UPI0020161DD6|nr:hypothetical protein [Pseudoalteromonas sp. S4488]